MKRFVLFGFVGVFLCGVVGFGGGYSGSVGLVSKAWSSEINPLATGAGIEAVQRFKLQRMGLSPEMAEKALSGHGDPICSQDASLLIGDYETLYSGMSGSPPNAEEVARTEDHAEGLAAELMAGDHCSLAGARRYWKEQEQEEKHREWLEKHPPYVNPDTTPEGQARLFFTKNRQAAIDTLIKADIDPVVAENASRLVTAQKGRFEECAKRINIVLHPELRTDAGAHFGGMDVREPDTEESVCDIARMYQDPYAEDPYQPSIERLIKAFQEDSKGTIRKLVKAGVERKWAKGAARLVPARQGRYRKCAVIMSALLDNLGDGGDITQHAQAINDDTYINNPDVGLWGVCAASNMEVDSTYNDEMGQD